MAAVQNRMTNVLLALVLIALISLIGMVASGVRGGELDPDGPPGSTMRTLTEIEPRIPITALPYTINTPGSYYLTQNLTIASAANGITISAADVVLDLNGFTLDGANLGGKGILATGAGTTVRNGTVTRWTGYGFDTQYGALLEDVHAIDNQIGIVVRGTVRGCTAAANTFDGVQARYSTVSDCFAQDNGTGFSLVDSSLTGCSALTNQTGIYAEEGSVVTNCTAEFNFTGISVGGPSKDRGATVVRNNAVLSSGADGIAVSGWNSVIADNAVSNSGRTQQASGMYVTGQRNRIEGNHVNDTNGYGILVTGGTGNLVVRNWADANGVDYFFGAQNDTGPIQFAASSTSPWANLTH